MGDAVVAHTPLDRTRPKLARERAHRTVRRIYKSAGDHPDPEYRKRLAAHAGKSEASPRIAAMLTEAQSMRSIRAEVADFDRDPWVLNVLNGTIDLRTGELREHRREDLLTHLTPVEYRPEARSDLWEKFLEDATKGKAGLADFLRRAAGYTLTGTTREDAIFAAHGPGGAGKTTFVETLKAALGPYAGSLRIEVLTTGSHSSGGHNEDIARLVGRRMVSAVEASENERLREGQVKHMTGGDTIPASLKHKPGFEFAPVFKLWLASNEVPYIRDDDSGMWRRLLKVPFENPHERSDLKDKLKRPEHLAGVLAWAVRGCLEWLRVGLAVPECVHGATRELRRQMGNGLELFVAHHCKFDPEAWTTSHELRAAYNACAEKQGIPSARRASDQRLGKALTERGCERDMRGEERLRGWWGIRLLESGPSGPSACPHFSYMSASKEQKSGDMLYPLSPLPNGASPNTNGSKPTPVPRFEVRVDEHGAWWLTDHERTWRVGRSWEDVEREAARRAMEMGKAMWEVV